MGHIDPPRLYQVSAKDFWIRNPRAYFAVDMGLGKTRSALMAVEELKITPLVIAPINPMYDTWPEEIKKWGFNMSHSIIHGANKLNAFNRKADIYLTNFESIPFIYKCLVALSKKGMRFPFNACIIDEGSMIKSPSTSRFKHLDAMRSVFPDYRLILSGTPSPNSLIDLWSQYYWLTDGAVLGKNITQFRTRFCTPHPYIPFKYDMKPLMVHALYEAIAPYTFRLDEDDHLELPERKFSPIKLKLPTKFRKLYQQFSKDYLVAINGQEFMANNKNQLNHKLWQLLQGFQYYDTGEFKPNGKPIRGTEFVHDLKAKALKDYMENNSNNVLVPIQFKADLEIIQKHFPDVPYITGKTPSDVARKHIKDWKAGKLRMLVCHPASLSHGLNLQSGGYTIIWYSLTNNLEHFLQLNKRLHRGDQKHTVLIYFLVFEKTIEYNFIKLLESKNATQKDLLDFLRDRTNYE